jgi:uncharacterized protein (DUF58 family)
VSRFLEPAVLGAVSSLELVARTVVDGFVAGLHTSADLGFSQEFAEYRAYTPGDEPRSIDWNVYARSERMYIKRYKGETNSLVTTLLDASNSMRYASHAVSKMNYARFIAAALGYLAIRKQRDAAGLLVFDDEVRNYIAPSTRHGQLGRLLAGLEVAEPRARTSFVKPLQHIEGLLRRRGIIVLLSDFYEDPQRIISGLEPFSLRGSEVLLLHVLDPAEVQPRLSRASLLVDLETGARMEVSADYAVTEYRDRIGRHIEALREGAQRARMGYHLLLTDRPLDHALREYLTVRAGRN